MPKLTNNAKRYQNPEVFEQLAIEYAVGSMQGRARKRFEVLMETHFYLRATVDAYENKFAALIELLPDAEASDKVWNNVEAHIKANSPQEEKISWWQTRFFKQSFGMAAMAFIVSGVLFFNPMTEHSPIATASYSAVLESDVNGEPIAITKILKSDMKLSINIMKEIYVADDMELTLWCQPKGGGVPMKMGTVSKSGKTEIKISKEEWKNMKNIGLLAVSVERKGNSLINEPTGKIILQGQLSSAD